ncbi:MAG: hypothetical protein HPY74_18230 [Firmicutes bacterium]|nr:hypothetical protein [Bacillota bacterium]
MRSVGILGYGYYLPELVLANHELAGRFGKTEDWIEERTGIKERRITEFNAATSDLAIKAALAALDRANLMVFSEIIRCRTIELLKCFIEI